MIDMSHANSQKDHRRQLAVCDDICKQLADNESRIMGVMIESNLVEGNQKISTPEAMTYGQSVTDACIGWEDSVDCLAKLAEAECRTAELTRFNSRPLPRPPQQRRGRYAPP